MLRVLSHLHSSALALAEAQRVLAPGGRLVVVAHGAAHLAGLPGAVTTADSPGRPTRAEPQLIMVPLVLTTADQVTLAASYGRTFRPQGQLETVLHLSGWTLCQG